MKIKIEIDVPEYVEGTHCAECPFEKYSNACYIAMEHCKDVDFSLMEIRVLGD